MGVGVVVGPINDSDPLILELGEALSFLDLDQRV
jgi:hypothetical protein